MIDICGDGGGEDIVGKIVVLYFIVECWFYMMIFIKNGFGLDDFIMFE